MQTQLSPQKHQVERFYQQIWNEQALRYLPSIVARNFKFRGSIGLKKRGHEEFLEYVSLIHNALGEYTCEILQLVEEENTVVAKMRFHGIHQQTFMGVAPTLRHVEWHGTAFFTFNTAGLIRDVWVLGDVKQLESQLQNDQIEPINA